MNTKRADVDAAQKALAAAHYFLNEARGNFCLVDEDDDATNEEKCTAFELLNEAEQDAIEAGEELLSALFAARAANVPPQPSAEIQMHATKPVTN